MKARSERGIALVLSLFLMMAMSVMAATLMFMAQTETYSSMNYRMMSQARYGAESGIQKAANFLIYDTSYPKPCTGCGDSITSYNTGVSPVTFNGNPVVLSANSAVTSNYPNAGVIASFQAAAGYFQIGSTNSTQVNFAPYATLISMEEISAADAAGGSQFTIQTWQITADGTIAAGTRNAQVQVTAVIDTSKITTTGQAINYATFAKASTCGALTFSGGSTTDAYTYNAATNTFSYTAGGNVGTNGNLTESGSDTVINGSLATPRVGVGNCSAGNVNAETSSGHATVTGGITQLPQAITLPDPVIGTAPTNTVSYSSHATATFTPASCPALCGNISLSGGSILHLTAGTYNINSISLSGNSQVIVDSGPVILQVSGASETTPIDFSGGTVTGSTVYDSYQLQIQYAGTGNVKLSGGSGTAAVVYAPNSTVSFSGGSDFYGEVVANTISDTGGTKIHYDSNLASKNLFTTPKYTAGNPMMSAFSWKKS